MARRVEGLVEQVRCGACAAAFPTFTFSGDTDLATDGLFAVTEMGTGLLALDEATKEEYWTDYATAWRMFAERSAGIWAVLW